MYVTQKNRLALQEAVHCNQREVVCYFIREAEMEITKLDQVQC